MTLRPKSRREWFQLWQRDYGHLPTITAAARRMAPKFGLDPENLRKTLSKSNTIENRKWYSEQLINPAQVDPSVKRQEEVISNSKGIFDDHQKHLATIGRPAVGVYISDKHTPLHRLDAWELLCNIVEDMTHVDYISVMSDWSDNNGWSLRWEDIRASREKIWAEDIAYSDKLEMNDYETLKLLAPEAKLIAVLGNHELWRYKKLRSLVPQASERVIADYMEDMYDVGVLQFSRGRQMNFLELSPGLIWLHGTFAAKTAMSNARNTAAMFSKQGMVPNIVFGHTHRGTITHGHQIGLTGIKIVNNPALCKNEGFEYLALGKSNSWNQGFTVCYFSPTERYVSIQMIEFEEVSDKLVAIFNGVKYDVKLNKD